MMFVMSTAVALASASLLSIAYAQSCSTTLTPGNNVKPSLASGYEMALVATGLTKPRSLQFDNAGNLLVVEQSNGVSSHAIRDDGGLCLSFKSSNMVIQNKGINHGIALSADGKTLYASTTEAAYSWDYDDATMTVGSTNKTIVNGMQTDDHTTRTLLLSKQVPNMLVVSRGSTSNLDVGAETLSTGRSQIRAFDITSSTPHDYSTSGTLLGWGLRNSVGVTEHPITGSIYSVENSVDQMMRMGSDVHENNPGEEMNFHGYLNGTKTTEQGSNYGYPNCFAAWQPADLPGNENIKVGTQFAIGDQNATVNDTTCTQAHAAPRLTFQAHMAPLDMKFNASGTEGWTTFHGSWDRTSPSGYKVSVIQFDRATGEPTVPSTSNSSYTDVFYNADNSVCPDSCFRPVGLAFDTMGRMWVSSDATGEIYVVRRVGATSAANGTALGTGSGASSTSTSMSGVSKVEVGWGMGAVVVGLVGAVVFFAL